MRSDDMAHPPAQPGTPQAGLGAVAGSARPVDGPVQATMASGSPTASAERTASAAPDDPHAEGEHEIAGFRVGVNPVPGSVIAVIIALVLLAVVAWIPINGF